MNKPLKVFIIAGEKSGDELGGSLLKNLKLNYKNIKILGVGGPKMLEEGLKSIFDIKELSIMGIVEVITKIPKIYSLLKLTETSINKFDPDIIITIDSPGFNLRLHKKIRYLKYKQVHYVAPSVWAWKSYRAKQISKYLDLLLVLFPFEKKYFTRFDLNTKFIGHPITLENKYISNNFKCEKSLLESNLQKVAILPGSRKSEINRLMPVFIEAAQLLKKNNQNIKFYIVTLKEFKDSITNMLNNKDIDYYLTDNANEKYNIYPKVDFALCASGTVTLEVAKALTPMLVVYKLNYITWWILNLMVKVNTATILNIVLEKNIIPELFQNKASANNIYLIVNKYLNDKELRFKQLTALRKGIQKIQNDKQDPNIIATNSIRELINKV